MELATELSLIHRWWNKGKKQESMKNCRMGGGIRNL